MTANEIIEEVQKRIENHNKDIKHAGESHQYRLAHELTVSRDTLINLLYTINPPKVY